MTLHTLEKTVQNEKLIFTNQRALFWEKNNSLIISDLHLGKTAYFRKNGIPVPSDILEDDLERLDELIQHFEAKELLVVGDFLHAGKNTDFELFEIWRKHKLELKITVIKGNHDLRHASFLSNLNIVIIEDFLFKKPFTFIHIPENTDTHFSISGHLHPGVMVKLEKRKSVRLPCFRIAENQIILPAFSKFTGLDTQCCQDFECIAFTEDLIFEL